MMFIHSLYFDRNWHRSAFILGAGALMAYSLEYTLVHLLGAYSYTNLPFNIENIPLVIPLGWVVTFYGIKTLSDDLMDLLAINHKSWKSITTSGLLALLFGLAIEVLARNTDFWIFYFEALELGGVPIVVTLAWGLSVAAFILGIELFEQFPKFWPGIMILVQLLNSIIAYVLIQFVDFV